jgi:FlgD Ig-like domain
VRTSTVTAQLIGPDNVPRVLEAAVAHPPGSYPFTFTAYDAEGTWRWVVQATDDLGRVSTVERSFRFDRTLKALTAPAVAVGRVPIRFTLARPATVRARIETKNGVVVQTLTAAQLQPGPQQLVWDGRFPQGTTAYAGSYVAHVFATSAVGTSDLAVQFTFRRAG